MSVQRPSFLEFTRENPAILLIGLAHIPFAIIECIRLWRLDHYQFFPFAILAFITLYWMRADRRKIHLGWFGRAILTVDLLLLLFTSVINWGQPAMYALVLYCYTVTRGTQEWEYPLRLTRLTLFAVLLARPLRRLDETAIQWLQTQTSWLASRVLESLGFLHLQRGNVLEVADKTFLVEEACSGVQSLFTVLFLATCIVCWYRRSLLQTLLLYAAGVTFAGAMNVLRISIIVIAWQNWEVDLSHGWQHDAIGYIALAGAVLMLLSADCLLHFLFAPFADHTYGPFAGVHSNPFTAAWNFTCGGRLTPHRPASPGLLPMNFVLSGCATLAVFIGCLQMIMIYANGTRRFALPESNVAVFDESALPQEMNGFQLINYSTETRDNGSNWGEFSNIWRYQGHGMSVVVSCDHPFLNWHYLNICYAGTGWNISHSDELKDDPEWHSITFGMKNEGAGRHGRVIYSHFTASGRPMPPVSTELSIAYVLERLRSRSGGGLWSMISEPEDNTSYQVQLFTESGRPLTDEQFTALRQLHVRTRQLLHESYQSTQVSSAVSLSD